MKPVNEEYRTQDIYKVKVQMTMMDGVIRHQDGL